MGRNGLTRYMSAEERFLARVEKTDTCWIWTGPLRGHRYAVFMVNGVDVMGHRWAYEHWVGPIPEGHQIDHMCAVTKCVNPEHLRPLVGGDNVRAYWREQRATCRNGHEMTEENVVYRQQGRVRTCRTCWRAKERRYKARQKAGLI